MLIYSPRKLFYNTYLFHRDIDDLGAGPGISTTKKEEGGGGDGRAIAKSAPGCAP